MSIFQNILNWFFNRGISVSTTVPTFNQEEKVVPKDILDWTNLLKDGSKNWSSIVVHHSATKDGVTNDWQAIRKYHTSYRIDGSIVSKEDYIKRKISKQGETFEEPWKDIGYHFGIESVSNLYNIEIGRGLSMFGAHTTQNKMNEKAIGICVVGNYDLLPPPEQAYRLLVRLCKEVMRHYPTITTSSVYYHNQFAEKTCPGKQFAPIDKFRKDLVG